MTSYVKRKAKAGSQGAAVSINPKPQKRKLLLIPSGKSMVVEESRSSSCWLSARTGQQALLKAVAEVLANSSQAIFELGGRSALAGCMCVGVCFTYNSLPYYHELVQAAM